MKSRTTALFIASILVTGLTAQVAVASEGRVRLVKDIYVGSPSGLRKGSNPPFSNLTNVDGTLFFTARDTVQGWELWKSDGTEAGTVLLKDFNTGGDSYPDSLTEVAGTLFLAAEDTVNGFSLWKSDGTEAGTVMVKDIAPDPSDFGALAEVGGTLFVSAFGTDRFGLWKSDGTEAGTVLVKDFNSRPLHLTDVGGTLFFEAPDGGHGWELWRSDGTKPGTVLVEDIDPTGDSRPHELTAVGGALFFSADDGFHGRELWKAR